MPPMTKLDAMTKLAEVDAKLAELIRQKEALQKQVPMGTFGELQQRLRDLEEKLGHAPNFDIEFRQAADKLQQLYTRASGLGAPNQLDGTVRDLQEIILKLERVESGAIETIFCPTCSTGFAKPEARELLTKLRAKLSLMINANGDIKMAYRKVKDQEEHIANLQKLRDEYEAASKETEQLKQAMNVELEIQTLAKRIEKGKQIRADLADHLGVA